MWGKFDRSAYAGAGTTKVGMPTSRTTGGIGKATIRFTNPQPQMPPPGTLVGSPMNTGGAGRATVIPGINGQRGNYAEGPTRGRGGILRFIR